MRFYLACLAVFCAFCCSYSYAETDLPVLSVEIPMRDGVKLPADIYLPEEGAQNLPCILIRAPNGRLTHCKALAPLALKGYAVVIQDTRSCIDSEGKTMPYLADGWGTQQDGFDTVQWLSKSPYTNGKVGTLGASAQGITQLLMAPSCPPNLVCQHIGVAASSIFDQGIFAGGQLRKHQVEQWLNYYAPHPSVLDEVASQPSYNDFWSRFDTCKVAHRVEVPAIHHGGWYDTFCQGTIDSFLSRQKNGGPGARGNQKMIIGPWTHFWPESKELGDYPVPVAGQQAPVDFSPDRWFEYYLKGIDNGIDAIPAVTYYVMGPFDGSPSSGNVWRTAETWPPEATQTSLYLEASGKLVEKSPDQGSIDFCYDPANPCPTLGGRNLFLKAGPVDQRPLEERDDVLVFTSEPLKGDTEVTGRITAQVLFSTNVKDTDVVVRLTDVYPDGSSVLISDGIRKLSDVFPEGHTVGKPRGPRYIDVDLWSTSMVFAKGHRIRVSISGSNYPRFDRATNLPRYTVATEPYPIAKNSVHVGGVRGSRIILPIVRKS
jgi:predicted acyl esterase